MFNGAFAILMLWLMVDVFWMLCRPRDIVMRRICAWLNVIAVVAGFWIFYGVEHLGSGIAPWFIMLNWINVVAAGLEFYFGYQRRA